MEYVSVLAGAPFSDHPRGTDPTLAALARLVNDACTDAGRPLLATFAPQLAGIRPLDPRGTAAVVLAAVSWAYAAAGEPASLRRTVRGAQRRYVTVTGAGVRAAMSRHTDVLHRCGSARHRLEACVAELCTPPGAQRDTALRGMLAAALAAAVASTGGSPRDPVPRDGAGVTRS